MSDDRTIFECRTCSAHTGGFCTGEKDKPGWAIITHIDGPNSICAECISKPNVLDDLLEEYPFAEIRKNIVNTLELTSSPLPLVQEGMYYLRKNCKMIYGPAKRATQYKFFMLNGIGFRADGSCVSGGEPIVRQVFITQVNPTEIIAEIRRLASDDCIHEADSIHRTADLIAEKLSINNDE